MRPAPPTVDPIWEQQCAEEKRLQDEELKRLVAGVSILPSPNSLLTNDLTSTLMNPQITDSASIKYFEFDLGLSDNQSSIYFKSTTRKIKYDTLTFQSNINIYHKIWLWNDALLTNVASYPAPGISSGSDWFVITTTSNNSGTHSINYVDLPNTPTPAIHVKMEIKNCNHSSVLTQVFGSSLFAWYTVDPNVSPPYLSYDNVDITSNLTFSGCGPVQIFTITPDSVAGGIGDTVTITGNNFGSSQGTGNIFLKDAQEGGHYYISLDSNDIVPGHWTNTEIKFVMPGIVEDIGSSVLNSKFGVPGTGPLKLETSTGDTAAGAITVIYSRYTDRDTVTGEKRKITPWDWSQFQNRHGIDFYCDTSFYQHADRMMCLKKAMKDWICLAEMHFEITDTLTTNSHTYLNDTINMIQFGTTPIGVLSETHIVYPILQNTDRPYYQADMIFSDLLKPNLYCDTTPCDSLPAGMVDFYALALHEFGHAHGLNHVNDSLRGTMFYAVNNGMTPYTDGSYRKIYLDYDTAAKKGAQKVMYDALHSSFGTVFSGAPIVPIHLTDCHRGPSASECHPPIIGIEEIEKRFGLITLFPNPANTKLTVEFSSDSDLPIQVQVLDITGRCMSLAFQLMRNEKKFDLDVSNFSTGFYLLKFTSPDATGGAMFIKN